MRIDIDEEQAARADHLLRIGGGAVGVDDPAAGQGGNARGEVRVGAEDGEVDLVHLGQVGAGVDAVVAHQPGQRRAVVPPIERAQAVGLPPVDGEGAHHPVGHPEFDLVKKPGCGRIERVVEVEDPGADMGKAIGQVAGKGECRHGGRLDRRRHRRNTGEGWTRGKLRG